MLPSTILISEAWGLCSRQQALAKGLCRDDRKTIPILVVPKGIPLTSAVLGIVPPQYSANCSLASIV